MSTGPLSVRNGILVADGYGVKVTVERRHLVVEDGICDERRHGRFGKATAKLKRLVILGHTGFITLDAVRWLKDAAAGLAVIDADGQVLMASGPPGLDDARLRRAQALAASNGVGLAIARNLLKRKLQGQADVAEKLGATEVAAHLREEAGRLDAAANAEQMRWIESQAAARYWELWAALRVTFARKDQRCIATHWATVGPRTSPLTGSPRLAVTPAQAMRNLLFAGAETEARIALLAMGLDPAIAVVHHDQPGRDSFALDVLESIRSDVDDFLLTLLQHRVFGRSDFAEDRRGVCRVLSPLSQFLVETAPRWAQAVGPIVEEIAHILIESAAQASRRKRALPTPLTQANRSTGREGLRGRPRRTETARAPKLPQACRSCGVLLERRNRLYCDDCLPEHEEAFERAGPAALRRLRADGHDPAHGGEAGRRRGTSNAKWQREAASWNRVHPNRPDSEVFRREILPHLQGVSLGRIAKATGLTRMYCSMIRRGLYVPHQRHWETMKGIVVGQ